MDKTKPTEQQIDHIIRLLYKMYAEKLGVEIEITRKGEDNERINK